MNLERQRRAPIKEALEELLTMRVVPFDVPGHKRGKGNPELTEFLGKRCLELDVNSMKPLDNLGHPVSVIREAEDLAAEAFGAAHAFFMVGGTTSSVQASILYACKEGDEIILPRNVHKSALAALILCGARPVYVIPPVNTELGMALGTPIAAVKETMDAHPNAKAIFLNNPTYYGVCSDIKKITELAHERGMLVIVDEAHGAHFSFGGDLPISGMAAGADLSAISMHKSGGSLTQSAFLVSGPNIDSERLRQIIGLAQTTSASYLLMSSLDISRKNMALSGKEVFQKVEALTLYARDAINKIGGYYAYGDELVDGDTVYAFDPTKLTVNTTNTGLSGIEVYDLLRDEYDMQIELGDTANILAYVSVGDRLQDLERLVTALSEIRRRFSKPPSLLKDVVMPPPIVKVTPKEAFYSLHEAVPVAESKGRIIGETVMCYPPGIPILSPGEEITEEALEYLLYAGEKGCFLSGTKEPDINYLQVLL